MDKSTCSVASCDKMAQARSYCGTHYSRWRATGNPLRPCRTCGQDCGSTYGPKTFCSDACRPSCAVDKCPAKVDGASEYCRTHRGGIYRYGRLPTYTWADERKCVVCGATEFEGKGRKVCSGKCQQILSRNGGTPPEKIKQCVRCTTLIDLTALGPSGRKKRADVQLCDTCRRSRMLRHRMSVTELADRDGTDCGICSTPINMTLTFPDVMRASVDHIMPFASGGSHDPTNLQLAHLRCNVTKQNKPGFVM